MPLMTIFLDKSVPAEAQSGLAEALPQLRAHLCARLDVPLAAAQMAIAPVTGLPDQPQANAEIRYLARPDRTPDLLNAVAQELRAMIREVSGLHAAIRLSALDPATYVALK